MTDPPDLSRPAGSNTPSGLYGSGGLDKLVSRMNPDRESVSLPRPRKGVREASGSIGSKKFN
jgi:hypothetical protein